MSWISGNCQNNRHYSCYYMNFSGTAWCRDSNDVCLAIDDGGSLYRMVDNWAPKGGW